MAPWTEGWLWVAQCCSNPATDEHRLSEQFRSIARAKVGDRRLWTVQGRESPVETVATADEASTAQGERADAEATVRDPETEGTVATAGLHTRAGMARA